MKETLRAQKDNQRLEARLSGLSAGTLSYS